MATNVDRLPILQILRASLGGKRPPRGEYRRTDIFTPGSGGGNNWLEYTEAVCPRNQLELKIEKDAGTRSRGISARLSPAGQSGRPGQGRRTVVSRTINFWCDKCPNNLGVVGV